MKRNKNGTFQKGNPGGPGRPELPREVKELKALNRFELERRINEFMQLTPIQLKAVLVNPESTTLELLIASVITRAVNKGDHTRFDFLLNQLIGKRPDTLNINSINTNISASTTISKMVKNPEILEELIKLESRLRDSTNGG